MVSATQKNQERGGDGRSLPFAPIWIAFTLLAILTPVFPDSGVKNSVLQICFSILLGLYSTRFWKGSLRGGIVDALLLMFILYAALSCVWPFFPGASLQHFFRYLPAWGVFLLLRQTNAENDEKSIWLSWTAAIFLAAVLGSAQVLSIRWISPCSPGDKVFSTFGSSEAWTLSLLAIAPFLILSKQWSFWREGGKIRFVLGLLILINFLFSGVLSAGLGLVTAGLVLFVACRAGGLDEKKIRKTLFILGLSLVVVGVWLAAQNASPMGERLSVWKSSIQMFGDEPLLGWGGGAFYYQGASYLSSGLNPRIAAQPDFASHVHNEALELLVEYGVVGLGICFAFAFALVRPILRASPKRTMKVWLGFSALAGAWVASLFSSALRQPSSVLVLFVAMAWWSNEVQPSVLRHVSRPIVRTAALALAFVAVVLFWNATRTVYLDRWIYPTAGWEEHLPQEPRERISVLEGLWSRHRGRAEEGRILYALGDAYKKMDRLKNAESVLNIAHQLDPKSIEICLLLGDAYFQDSHGDQDVMDSAVKAYVWGLEIQPENVELLTARAKVNCSRKSVSECSVDLQHILRLQPGNQWAKAELDVLGR